MGLLYFQQGAGAMLTVHVNATLMEQNGCGSKPMYSIDCEFVDYLTVLYKLQMGSSVE
jgi:hypothetical protein